MNGGGAQMIEKIDDINKLNEGCLYLEGNFDTHLLNVKRQAISLYPNKMNENEIISRKYTFELSQFFQVYMYVSHFL